jgi:hypothetical protein
MGYICINVKRSEMHQRSIKINRFILYREIIAFYSENIVKPVNTFFGKNAVTTVKSEGTRDSDRRQLL